MFGRVAKGPDTSVTHSSLTATQIVPTAAASFQAALAVSRRLAREDSGQDLIEYALIAASIGLATVAGIHGLASSVAGYLNFIGGGFSNAIGP
jgi:pilus assembly protein Flp/PilA